MAYIGESLLGAEGRWFLWRYTHLFLSVASAKMSEQDEKVVIII